MAPRIGRLVAVVMVLMMAPSGQGAAVPASPDVAIREGGNGLQVFVVDPNRRRLLFAIVPPTRSVPVASFGPFTPCGSFEAVAAIAVRGSRLIVATSESNPAVVECNLDTGSVNVLHRGEPLRVPTSVAIDADGSIAVVDRVLRSVVVLRRDARPAVIRVSGSPMMIRSDDLGQLYVVDSEAKGIVPIQLKEMAANAPNIAAQAQQSRPNAYLSLTEEPSAFAVYRDVFYVADTSGALRAQLPAGRLSIEIPDVRPRQGAIAASKDYLVTVDRDATAAEIIPRPIPAGLVLDPTRGNPNEAWLQILEFVSERRLLPRDRVTVTPTDTTYEALLMRTGVLLNADLNPGRVALPAGRANKLFCTLNPTLCDTGYSPKLPVVVIPQASPQPVLQTETVALNGKDVRTLVNERLLLASHQKEVNDAYLTTRNPSSAATLENELLRRKMVMATPMSADLVAGNIIRIQNGKEVLVGALPSCEGARPTIGRTSLISHLTAPRDAIPDAGVAADAPVLLDVGSWTRSTISTAALEKCRVPDDLQGAYVITESLAIAGTTVSLPASARGPATSRTLNETLYVGYRAVPLSALAAGISVPADPDRLKPMPSSAPNEIWKINSGSLTLPVTRWRTDVLLPASEFYTSNSALRKLQGAQPAIDLSPRERLDRAALSSSMRPLPPDAALEATLQAAHDQLVGAIHYESALAAATGTEDVFIGIVEDSSSVNLDHPGFVSDNQSAWFDFVDSAGILQPHRPQAGNAASTLRRVNAGVEHGTHVAGTIAARGTPVIGMLPKTQLFLVPSDNMAGLKEGIETARNNLVSLFNMSLGFPAGTSNDIIQDLHTRMKDGWKDALFVVAAGNDGADLNVTGAQAPVFWSTTLPNVLTVGATDSSGNNILGQHRDGMDEEERKGSNFGSQYVDLVAPGQTIHSLGKDGYAYACGSSHAAPQVTATAAMLWETASTKPEVVRARLIYTADWKEPNFDKKVWGGLLNVHRAVFAPRTNVYVPSGNDSTPREIKFKPDVTVSINGDIQNRNGSTTTMRDMRFPFTRVLRIEPIGAGKSRIVLLSKPNDVLTVVKGTIQGEIKCTSVKKYDKQTQQFSLDPDPPVNCGAGVSVGGMNDYVAATPAAVRFQ